MDKQLHHFIGGERVAGTSGRFGDVFNPATGEVESLCPYASAAEIDAAVEMAPRRRGGPGRRRRSPSDSRSSSTFRNEFIAAREQLAEVIGREHGKTTADAFGELQRSLEAIEFACSMPHLTKGEYSLNIGGNIDNFSVHQPLGVVGCISPFNFPAMVPRDDGHDGRRRRQRCDPQAVRACPVRGPPPRRALAEGRASRRRLERRQR